MMIAHKGEKFILNDYMIGNCPKCGEWEAPITLDELVLLPNREEVHCGSGEKVIDKHTLYHRETWEEFFCCPVCQTRFAVPYSNL